MSVMSKAAKFLESLCSHPITVNILLPQLDHVMIFSKDYKFNKSFLN